MSDAEDILEALTDDLILRGSETERKIAESDGVEQSLYRARAVTYAEVLARIQSVIASHIGDGQDEAEMTLAYADTAWAVLIESTQHA